MSHPCVSCTCFLLQVDDQAYFCSGHNRLDTTEKFPGTVQGRGIARLDISSRCLLAVAVLLECGISELLLGVEGVAGGDSSCFTPGRAEGEDDGFLFPECGKKLEREREAATAPHSCKSFQVQF